MPHATLLHTTVYSYERPVRLGPQWIRLRPMPNPRAPQPRYALRVSPEPTALHWLVDPLGNLVARAVVPGPTGRLRIEVELGLDLSPRNPFDFVLDPDAVRWPFRYAPDQADTLAVFRHPDHPGPLLAGLLAETAPAPDTVSDTVAFVLVLGAAVRDRVAYVQRTAPGVWPPDRTLAEGQGSCRDTAWLLVQLLRLHGVAARFVSGYLLQPPVPGAPMPPDAELHAWAEAFLPGAGWLGVDPTSGLLTAEGHVAIAASPDPSGAAPLVGTVEPARVTLETSIAVELLP